MSYHTEVEVWYSGDDGVSVDLLVEAAAEYVEAEGCYAEDAVLTDLRKVFVGKKFAMDAVLFNDLVCSDFEELFQDLSARLPAITFLVRGRGEEPGDLWLREFRAGEITRGLGPLDEDAGSTA